MTARGARFDERGLRRAWASAQLLAGAPPGGRHTVAGAVAAVVGVQAQDRTAAGLAVRARTTGLSAADVDAAVARDRSVVLTWSLRGTRHLHAAADAGWIRGLLGPAFAGGSPKRTRDLGIDGTRGDDAVRALRGALDARGSLTRREVKDRLAACGVDPTGQAPIHVVRRAALEGVLWVVPEPGGEERYVAADAWLPATPPRPADEAVAELARRYLAACGPAAPPDFAAWSGLGITVARRAWAALGGELVEVDEPRGRSWILGGGGAASSAAGPVPVRLLGAFDNLLLGHADRSPVLAPAHARRVNVGGGMVRPVLLADGEVVGTWRGLGGRGPYRVELSPFGDLPSEVVAGIVREIADIGRFLGTGAISVAATG